MTYYYKTNNLTRINWLNTRLIIASNKIRHEIPFKTKRVKYTVIWKKSIKIVKESKPSFFYIAHNVLLTPLPFQFYFPPQFFLFPSPKFYYFPSSMFFIPLLHFLIYSIYFSIHKYIDLLATLHRPHIHPTSIPHRPHVDPTSTTLRPTSAPYRPNIDPTSTSHRPYTQLFFVLTLLRK